jgi:hypothetical protein
MKVPKHINYEWIYVAKCPYTYSEKTKMYLIKVGKTSCADPDERMISLNKAGCPGKPIIIKAILVPKNLRIEKIMHEILKYFRIHGKEFFEIFPEQALSHLDYFEKFYKTEVYNSEQKYEFNPNTMYYSNTTDEDPEAETEAEPENDTEENKCFGNILGALFAGSKKEIKLIQRGDHFDYEGTVIDASPSGFNINFDGKIMSPSAFAQLHKAAEVNGYRNLRVILNNKQVRLEYFGKSSNAEYVSKFKDEYY